jgi:thymidylate synthase
MVLVCIMVNTLTDYNVTRSKVLEKKYIVMNIEHDYLRLLKDILDNGVEKEDRTGTGTISVFGRQIRHKMNQGFPLLTTKKMYWKGIVTELLWFLRGDTNIKYLVDNDCHIWDGDAYKNYERRWESEGKLLSPPLNKFTKEEFINEIKTNWMNARELGELGPIYGKQWRSWETIYDSNVSEWAGEGEDAIPIYKVLNKHDQIENLIEQLKTNPDSRRLMVNAWNVGELDQMTLPPCHYGFQVYTRELSYDEKVHEARKRFGFELEDGTRTFDINTKESIEFLTSTQRAISLMWNQRSVDTFLGLPFNIASYGLLLEIIAKEVNMVPNELIGNLGDVHLYKNHIEQAKEQMTREPKLLPTLKYTKSLNDIDEVFKNLKVEQFEIENYQPHPTIKAPLNN